MALHSKISLLTNGEVIIYGYRGAVELANLTVTSFIFWVTLDFLNGLLFPLVMKHSNILFFQSVKHDFFYVTLTRFKVTC